MANIGRDFITAGNAIFTLVGKDSRFTFKVTRKDPSPGYEKYGVSYFVSVLNGPDNYENYLYMGMLDPVTGNVRLTRNSKVGLDAPSFKAINWALPKIFAGAAMPPAFSIHHEGKCGRCGRRLTVPESILTGIGPECAALMGLPMVEGVSPAPKPKRQRKPKAPVAKAADLKRQHEDYRHSMVQLAELAGQVKQFDMDNFLRTEL